MRHYLDHASTSPLRPVAKDAIKAGLDLEGDPSRIHAEGLEARYGVEQARENIARFLGAKPREVVFTSGATESITSAIWGVMSKNPTGSVLTSTMEHSSVLESADQFPLIQVGVDSHGLMDPERLAQAVTPETALVSLQHVNHEVGTIQDIDALLGEIRNHSNNPDVLIHIDCAQSIGHIPFDFAECGADLVSMSSHKFGGPTGVGVLLIRQGLRIQPLLKGGSQERARRGGIENKAAIMGLEAVIQELDGGKLEAEATAARQLTQLAVESCSQMEGMAAYSHPDHRAPHIVCFGFQDIEPQAILLELDRRNISVHSGSSCASEEIQPSPVLAAIGVDAERSLRVSVGWNSTKSDVEAFSAGLKEAMDYLYKLRG